MADRRRMGCGDMSHGGRGSQLERVLDAEGE